MGALELAKPILDELGKFLNDFPVISNEDEARKAKAISDRVFLTLKSVKEERDAKVRPLNERVAAINAEYHHWFSTNDKKPGLWGTLLRELKVRLTAFAGAEEQKRRQAAEAARRAAEETERKAREAEAREQQAAAEAAQGVCDTDFAGVTERADAAFAEFQRADWAAQRAERNATVRIGGGFGKVATLRNKEILAVTDWRAAISEIGLTDRIAEAILTEARAYRPTSPEDSERMFVCATLTALIRAGEVKNDKQQLWAATQMLRGLWKHTSGFDGHALTASEAGRHNGVTAQH